MIVLHCGKGGSDKLYIIGVVRHEESGSWMVMTKHGRRGSRLISAVHGTYVDEATANAAAGGMARKKMARGYEDIEDMRYSGPLRMSDLEIVAATKGMETTSQPSRGHVKPAPPVSGKDGHDDESTPDDVGATTDGKGEGPPNGIQLTLMGAQKGVSRKCRCNHGREDQFVLGERYDTWRHEDKDMIWAANVFGERVECLRERFE